MQMILLKGVAVVLDVFFISSNNVRAASLRFHLARLLLLIYIKEFLEKITLGEFPSEVLQTRQNTYRKLSRHIQKQYLNIINNF